MQEFLNNLVRFFSSVIWIFFHKDNQWSSTENDSVFTINFYIVSSVKSSSSNNCLQFQWSWWIIKLFKINILIYVSHFKSLCPDFRNKYWEFISSWYFSKRIFSRRNELIKVKLPILIIIIDFPLHDDLITVSYCKQIIFTKKLSWSDHWTMSTIWSA